MLNEDIKKFLHKNIKTTRTYKYPIELTIEQAKLFEHAQACYRHFFNFGLHYLYKHFGYYNEYRYFSDKPKPIQYLVLRMKKYAIRQMLKREPQLSLKSKRKLKYWFDSQSISKLYEQLIINFSIYHQQQYNLSYQAGYKIYHNHLLGKGHPLSDGQIMYEIDKHRKYTGYGRIAYVHNDDHFKTILFKANGGQSIKWLNPFTLQIPKFGKIHLLTALNKNELHPNFTEIKLKQLKNDRYQLQITTPKKFKKNLRAKNVQSLSMGIDWGTHPDRIFMNEKGQMTGFPIKLRKRLSIIDSKLRKLDQQLDGHKKDNSVKTKLLTRQRQNLFNKQKYLLKDWMRVAIKQWYQKYDCLCIEKLSPIEMRSDKKQSNYNLAHTIPGIFKQLCQDIAQSTGKLLLEIDPYLTSKTCHHCGYINNKLKPGMESWTCPICHHYLDRDQNAAINIKTWAFNPIKHIKYLLSLKSKSKIIIDDPNDLLTIF